MSMPEELQIREAVRFVGFTPTGGTHAHVEITGRVNGPHVIPELVKIANLVDWTIDMAKEDDGWGGDPPGGEG
jgi:hypothetical protein